MYTNEYGLQRLALETPQARVRAARRAERAQIALHAHQAPANTAPQPRLARLLAGLHLTTR
ncbi:MAG TPA: hypothetical protein VFM49_13345 [Chloroflexia bacterium]|jgi:hypothetical protein|nr:hypothetical protein [Chloroflexia bacterium]